MAPGIAWDPTWYSQEYCQGRFAWTQVWVQEIEWTISTYLDYLWLFQYKNNIEWHWLLTIPVFHGTSCPSIESLNKIPPKPPCFALLQDVLQVAPSNDATAADAPAPRWLSEARWSKRRVHVPGKDRLWGLSKWYVGKCWEYFCLGNCIINTCHLWNSYCWNPRLSK